MKFKAIILEGADCCGKTSFANELFSREKNAILVHFPRINHDHSVEVAIKKLTATLYNPYFMEKFKAMGNYNFKYEHGSSDFLKMNREILSAIEKNIDANAEDKNNFLNGLEKIKEAYLSHINKNKTEETRMYLCDFLFYFERLIKANNISKLKIDNHEYDVNNTESEIEDKNTLMRNVEKMINSDENFTIIFDRFFMSGDVYNYAVPINIYKQCIGEIKEKYINYINKYIEFTKKPDEKEYELKEMNNAIDKLSKSILSDINDLRKDQIFKTKNIIKKCNFIFTNPIDEYSFIDDKSFVFDDKPVLNPIDITHIIFNTNNSLVEISKKDTKRKFDDYDGNDDIQHISRWCFDTYQKKILDPKEEKITIDEKFDFIENEYYVKSIVIDCREYLNFFADNDPNALVLPQTNGKYLVSHNNGETWKETDEVNYKIKTNKNLLDNVIEKINYLNDENRDNIINYFSTEYHCKRDFINRLSKTIATHDIGFEVDNKEK